MEALLLGGHTATLREGRITQFGPTAEIYRRPADLLTAQVFSNPPINTAPVAKQGADVVLSESVRWPAAGAVRNLPDGGYTVGIRPHHVSPVANGHDSAALEGKVLITELSGSESVIHFSHEKLSWVSHSHGVHAIEVGETTRFFMDVGRCMYFAADGKLLAS